MVKVPLACTCSMAYGPEVNGPSVVGSEVRSKTCPPT